MRTKLSQAQNVFESGILTVTSGGHWFHANRKTVEAFVPGLLEEVGFEDLVLDAVTWIESTDSIALLLFFALVFHIPTLPAAGITILFWFLWYYYKSAFVNLITMPLLRLINMDMLQIVVAAVALSLLGMWGYYWGVLAGVLYFFLFKVSLLRMAMDRIEARRGVRGLPLNDRVLKMVLVRHAIRENLVPEEASKLEEQVRDTILKMKRGGRSE